MMEIMVLSVDTYVVCSCLMSRAFSIPIPAELAMKSIMSMSYSEYSSPLILGPVKMSPVISPFTTMGDTYSNTASLRSGSIMAQRRSRLREILWGLPSSSSMLTKSHSRATSIPSNLCASNPLTPSSE